MLMIIIMHMKKIILKYMMMIFCYGYVSGYDRGEKLDISKIDKVCSQSDDKNNRCFGGFLCN